MMQRLFRGLAAAGCFLLAACATPTPDNTVKVELTGTPGARVTGYYIQDGVRQVFEGSLPMTLYQPGLSQLAVRKEDPAANLKVSARDNASSMGSSILPGDNTGLRLQLAGDWNMAIIPPEELLALPNPQSGVMTLQPYWYNSTWVFDDTAAGLQHEPFVQGVPEMVNALVKDIPNARDGFRLRFSAQPFQGYQKRLTWVQAKDGGNVYRSEDPPLEGWLCPALFRYFKAAPPYLYVQAEPLKK
jgi:hypothetical protein